MTTIVPGVTPFFSNSHHPLHPWLTQNSHPIPFENEEKAPLVLAAPSAAGEITTAFRLYLL